MKKILLSLFIISLFSGCGSNKSLAKTGSCHIILRGFFAGSKCMDNLSEAQCQWHELYNSKATYYAGGTCD